MQTRSEKRSCTLQNQCQKEELLEVTAFSSYLMQDSLFELELNCNKIKPVYRIQLAQFCISIILHTRVEHLFFPSN